MKASFFEDEFARNETGRPFEFLGTVFFSVGGDIFLGNAVYHGADFRPDAPKLPHSRLALRADPDFTNAHTTTQNPTPTPQEKSNRMTGISSTTLAVR